MDIGRPMRFSNVLLILFPGNRRNIDGSHGERIVQLLSSAMVLPREEVCCLLLTAMAPTIIFAVIDD